MRSIARLELLLVAAVQPDLLLDQLELAHHVVAGDVDGVDHVLGDVVVLQHEELRVLLDPLCEPADRLGAALHVGLHRLDDRARSRS